MSIGISPKFGPEAGIKASAPLDEIKAIEQADVLAEESLPLHVSVNGVARTLEVTALKQVPKIAAYRVEGWLKPLDDPSPATHNPGHSMEGPALLFLDKPGFAQQIINSFRSRASRAKGSLYGVPTTQ